MRFALAAKMAQTAELVYSLPKSSAPYVTTICTAGDLGFLWGDSGIVTCIDIPTHQQHWRQRVGGIFYSSPIRVGDRIYGTSTEGEVVVLAASADYRLLARNPLGEANLRHSRRFRRRDVPAHAIAFDVAGRKIATDDRGPR